MREKLSLSNMEQQAYDVNAKRLMAAGVIPHEDKPSSERQMLTVEQTGGPSDSFVHAPSVGGYVIAVWVRIVALKSGISVCDCQITPQRWNGTHIFLGDITEGVPSYKALGGVEYPKTDVLNHWISSERSLKFGQILKGVVVAQSFASLPAWCYSGIRIGAELCFFDQFGNLYPLEVDLMVMRDTKRTERPRRHGGLYGPLAASESMHGPYGEKPDVGSRASISPKENAPRTNGAITYYRRFT
jgi:hypothetical protein